MQPVGRPPPGEGGEGTFDAGEAEEVEEVEREGGATPSSGAGDGARIACNPGDDGS